MKRCAVMGLAVFALFTLSTQIALAQSYPSKPIRMVVAFSAGGPADVNARLFAQKMSQSLGQPIIVENKPGAGGNIAAIEVAKSPADGSTLFYNTAGIVIAPALYVKPGYDPLKDFAPVALTATIPLVLVLNPAFPARDARELIAYIKANPGKVNYASGSPGSTPHLAMAQIALQLDLKMNHIPYKGSAPALSDVVAGHVEMMIEPINTILPFVRDNRLRSVAILSQKRSALLPDLATFQEVTGIPFEASSWQGLLVPAGTPKEVIARLNAEVNKALQDPDLLQRFAATGSEPMGGTSEQYGSYLRSEVVRWAKVVKDAGVKID